MEALVNRILEQHNRGRLQAENSDLIHLASWLSCLAYYREEKVREELQQVFGDELEMMFIHPDMEGHGRYLADTELFLIRVRNLVVVAARGSEPSSWSDWAYTDLNHQMVPALGLGNNTSIKVHSGFAAALGVVWEDLYLNLLSFCQRARNWRPKPRSNSEHPPLLLLTGHSLGGAIANLLAASLANRHLLHDALVDLEGLHVQTFGQPYTGNQDYAEWYDNFELSKDLSLQERTLRHVYGNDIVCRVPSDELGELVSGLDEGWQHTGKMRYYDHHGVYQEDIHEIRLSDVFIINRTPHIIRFSALHDHVPWLYYWCGQGEGMGNPKFGFLQAYHEAQFWFVFAKNAVLRVRESIREMMPLFGPGTNTPDDKAGPSPQGSPEHPTRGTSD